MYNGVKHGGVISCHLFNLYVDPLLVQLIHSGLIPSKNGLYTDNNMGAALRVYMQGYMQGHFHMLMI